MKRVDEHTFNTTCIVCGKVASAKYFHAESNIVTKYGEPHKGVCNRCHKAHLNRETPKMAQAAWSSPYKTNTLRKVLEEYGVSEPEIAASIDSVIDSVPDDFEFCDIHNTYIRIGDKNYSFGHCHYITHKQLECILRGFSIPITNSSSHLYGKLVVYDRIEGTSWIANTNIELSHMSMFNSLYSHRRMYHNCGTQKDITSADCGHDPSWRYFARCLPLSFTKKDVVSAIKVIKKYVAGFIFSTN